MYYYHTVAGLEYFQGIEGGRGGEGRGGGN